MKHDETCSFCYTKAMAVAVQPAKEISEKKRTHTKDRRVVVTGMGVVTPLGHDPDDFYNNLLEGVSGISEIESFDCTSYPTVGLLSTLLLNFIFPFNMFM
jgi:hypothetical protein